MRGDLRVRADARLEAALSERALADPRDGFRARLRWLRETNPELFERAARHYEDEVLPGLAGEEDPVEAWVEYGRYVEELVAPGRTVAIDEFGRAVPYVRPLIPELLVLHVPEDRDAAAVTLAMPRAPSPAQRATCDLLVRGRLSL
jgi:hypothetical protein